MLSSSSTSDGVLTVHQGCSSIQFFDLVFLRPLWAGYMEEGDKTLEFPLTVCSSQQQEAVIVDWASSRGCFFMQRSPCVVKVSVALGVSPEEVRNGEY